MLTGVTWLGDVHLDKKFRTGVPLHRLGEREAMVWQQFEETLAKCEDPLLVQVGDLFDQYSVSETAVLKAAGLYKFYATHNPHRKFVIYRGNHDASRDVSKKSSFDVFAELMEGTPNVFVFRDTVATLTVEGRDYGFLPWHPFKTAEQLAFDLISETRGKKLEAVFCHCDVESFGGSGDNLIPTKILSQITDTVVTGHIHIPDAYRVDSVNVIITGSMQPYSHGEDLTGQLYKSLTLEEFNNSDMELWKNMNVRILLQPGEVLPAAIDCLSFIGKTISAISEEDEEDDSEFEVGFDSFNMDQLFSDALRERQVGNEVSQQIEKKYKELKIG